MIKLEINTAYYKKDTFWRQSKKESMTFYDINEALQIFKKLSPKYYINKKDMSAIETITLTYKIELGFKRYYKTIDPITEEIETNYKED